MTRVLLLMGLLTAGCGLEHYAEDADLTEPTCWTEKNSTALFWHVPKNAEVTKETNEICMEIHNVHNR